MKMNGILVRKWVKHYVLIYPRQAVAVLQMPEAFAVQLVVRLRPKELDFRSNYLAAMLDSNQIHLLVFQWVDSVLPDDVLVPESVVLNKMNC